MLFYPLYLCHTALCLVMGIVGLLFVLWFQIPRVLWISTLIGLFCLGGFYVSKVDPPRWEIRNRMWKRVLIDAAKHPISGSGLDSFRNITKNKPYKYMERKLEQKKRIWVEVWDNPHNLYISLFLEFSLVGLLIFGGYLRGLGVKYLRAIKSREVVGLTAFILVFLGISLAHFPLFLASFTPILIPAFGLTEVAYG